MPSVVAPVEIQSFKLSWAAAIQGSGINFFAQFSVKRAHPEFDQNGQRQPCNHKQAELYRLRMYDFPNGAFYDVKAYQQYKKRDHQSADVFNPSMPKRVSSSGRRRSRPKANKGYNTAAYIRKVVKRIACNGDGSWKSAPI